MKYSFYFLRSKIVERERERKRERVCILELILKIKMIFSGQIHD